MIPFPSAGTGGISEEAAEKTAGKYFLYEKFGLGTGEEDEALTEGDVAAMNDPDSTSANDLE